MSTESSAIFGNIYAGIKAHTFFFYIYLNLLVSDFALLVFWDVVLWSHIIVLPPVTYMLAKRVCLTAAIL